MSEWMVCGEPRSVARRRLVGRHAVSEASGIADIPLPPGRPPVTIRAHEQHHDDTRSSAAHLLRWRHRTLGRREARETA